MCSSVSVDVRVRTTITTSSVEQNITIVQRFCKAGNEGLSGDRCATTAHALAATTSTGGYEWPRKGRCELRVMRRRLAKSNLDFAVFSSHPRKARRPHQLHRVSRR